MADEDQDDPQLKSLRAVWLSMRDNDEDPPDSGVSALMAAARSQASMMAAAKAPWWKRMFDQLRRPPVLALASLVLVVCVGVLLANHHDALEKAPTSAPMQEKELPHGNLELGGKAAAPAPVAPDEKADGKDKADERADKKAPGVAPPMHRNPPPAPHTATGANQAPTVQPAPRAEAGFESDDAGKVKTEAKAEAATTAAPPSRVLVDQLAAQARKAAQRGDCENAKAIATRIAGQDATYYRDHVAGDLANCVSAPAAAADAMH